MIFRESWNIDITISNMERIFPEIPLDGKDFVNLSKLDKVVAIYKTNKQVFTKMHMSLKTRSSEKKPYSKSSCSRLIFCDQLIKCSVFLVSFWAAIKTEERTVTVSPLLAVVELT